METLTSTANYSEAAQRSYPPNSCLLSDIQKMIWLSEKTQIHLRQTQLISISISIPNRAIDRLELMKNDPWYQAEEISDVVFENTKKAIEKLDSFIRFLEPEEIGPSGNGTLLMNFEKDDLNFVLEIGATTVAHVYSDGAGKFISGSSSVDNTTYWDELFGLLSKHFNE